ncbi:DUF1549 domain-containing protein [Telmatocola sphagniphila]|uniref:DUF1549 domain-containing protein n=1 Tax=Telmatocola sphagniphila TaxID=1123043 RepID=A0A8E6BBK9_9BACT|nr:DUF1549 domain-containing protein [Telmatocola sphagniphila]QVL34158.1 DUF1549 domain-containing protein [Telmatocola sphagniphila]
MHNPRCIRWIFLGLTVLLYPAVSSAAESLNSRIDQFITEGYGKFKQEVSPRSDDAEFLRRIYLDLLGRIPSTAEARAFLEDRHPRKRERLIDRLLAKPEHARHLQQVFDVLFLERRADEKVPRAAWEEFLLQSLAANKPYDQLVRELLSTDGADPKTRPAAKFLLERNLEPVLLTRDISRIFLGRNLQCAQCHDHPLVDDYKQEDFYSIQAFYNRAFLYPNAQTATAVIAEKAEGEVSFVSAFDPKKTQKSSPPRVLMGRSFKDPKVEKGKEYKVAPAKDVKPIPAVSRFAKLAPAITGSDNPAFARTAVNRIWAQLMGRGLIHPLDFDHSGNPPSHPQLLEMLAEEFEAKQFDVRWLIREITLSESYQRSSECKSGTLSPDHLDRYLVANLKPLSPEQLAYSTLQATGFTDTVKASLGAEVAEPVLHGKLAPNATPIIRIFAALPGEPQDGFASTLDQTLFVKHNGSVRNLLNAQPNNLLDRCLKMPDNSAATEEIFLAVLTRYPTAAERAAIVHYLTSSKERSVAFSDVIWSLLASNEFRFNH